MAYNIYETEALVLGLAPVRERGLAVALLTRELGFVRARAEGVRTIQSKMRANLITYARVTVALVRGRNEWCITGVSVLDSFAPLFIDSVRGVCAARILHLYGRLIPDEETGHEVLFDDLTTGLALLADNGLAYDALEVLLVVRALWHLGYLPHDEKLIHLLCKDCALSALVDDAAAMRPHAVLVINRTLADTHL